MKYAIALKDYKYPFTFLLVLSLLITSCEENQTPDLSSAKPDFSFSQKPFFGMTAVDTPTLLVPHWIASSLGEYNGTFSPDGSEFFFTSNAPNQGIITQMIFKDQKWSTVNVAPFSGKHSEYDPLFTPDGKRLYFTSRRAISDSMDYGNANIWFVEKENERWSAPQYVKLSNNGDYYSSITSTGAIYYNVWNNGKIFKATPVDTGYVSEALPDVINSKNGQGDPFIAPDESYLIYRGYKNSLGQGDLYISFNIDNNWTAPENLGAPINSKYHEMCPSVTPDGKFFIFASNRLEEPYLGVPSSSIESIRTKHHSIDNGNQNIYYLSADFIQQMRSKFQ